MKALVRERQSLITQQSQVRNRLHALSASHKPSVSHRGRLQQQLRFFASQIREVEQQITEVLHNDDDFRGRIKQLQTIKGVGLMTIATILAETNGFALVRSVKQVISYAGLDIVHQESGTKRGPKLYQQAGKLPLTDMFVHASLSLDPI
ncbi:MAG: transposase [Candidatus Kapaibacterium sp.]